MEKGKGGETYVHKRRGPPLAREVTERVNVGRRGRKTDRIFNNNVGKRENAVSARRKGLFWKGEPEKAFTTWSIRGDSRVVGKYPQEEQFTLGGRILPQLAQKLSADRCHTGEKSSTTVRNYGRGGHAMAESR